MPKRKDIPKRKMSMQDLIHTRPEQKGIFFLNENKEFEKEKADIQSLFDREKKEIDKNIQEELLNSLTYNTIINKIPKEYQQFQPLNSYLIRFFRRVPELKYGNLYIPVINRDDIAKVKINSFTGQVITGKQVKSDFRFSKKAIVIAVPDYEKQIQPGDIVAVVPPEVGQEVTDFGSFLAYTGWFVHPDSNIFDPVQDVRNPHFGFALYSKNYILGKLGHAQIEFIDFSNE